MTRIDKAIETYDDYEAVLASRLARKHDMELTPELQEAIELNWEAGIAVDAAEVALVYA